MSLDVSRIGEHVGEEEVTVRESARSLGIEKDGEVTEREDPMKSAFERAQPKKLEPVEFFACSVLRPKKPSSK